MWPLMTGFHLVQCFQISLYLDFFNGNILFFFLKDAHKQKALRFENPPQEYHFPASLCITAVSNWEYSHPDLLGEWKLMRKHSAYDFIQYSVVSRFPSPDMNV